MTPSERSQYWAGLALAARYNAIVSREMAKQWPQHAKAYLASATDAHLRAKLYLKHARTFKYMAEARLEHAA